MIGFQKDQSRRELGPRCSVGRLARQPRSEAFALGLMSLGFFRSGKLELRQEIQDLALPALINSQAHFRPSSQAHIFRPIKAPHSI